MAWSLERVRTASIGWHASDTAPLTLNTPDAIKAGARAFSTRGCVLCHGAPGADWAKFSEGLRPGPPDLAEAAKSVTVEQIFWVVKNGINMTAMPSFGSIGVDDAEIWNIAAFVAKLPTVKDEDYKAWTAAAP